MSLYSSKIKTQLVDAVVNISNNRLEYKLPPMSGFYPTLRLAQFGSTGGDVAYNKGCGALALISRISLMNGAEELSSLSEANRYMSFKYLNSSNSDNASLFYPLIHHQQGYLINDKLKVQSSHQAEYNQAAAGNSALVQAQKAVTVDLMSMLPVLSSMPVLDTSVFSDLRIQIEYETDSRKVLHDNTAAFATRVDPVLVCEEIQDPKLVAALSSKFSGTVWNEIEHDVINLPANDNAADTELVQRIKETVNGFDNKYVSRMVMMKTFSNREKSKLAGAGAVQRGFGDFNSYAMHKEKINFAVNGKSLFVGDGLDSAAKRAMMLHDTWGSCNVVPFGHVEGVGVDGASASTQLSGVPVLNGTKQGEQVGTQDFIAVHLESRINQFEVEYERSTPKNDDAVQAVDQLGEALDLHMFCEVRKQLVVQNGRYVLQYV